MFIEPNVTGNVYAFSVGVEAPISMMGGVVTKKYARGRTNFHFVLVVRSKMRITLTSKNTKKRKIGFVSENLFKRRDGGLSS